MIAGLNALDDRNAVAVGTAQTHRAELHNTIFADGGNVVLIGLNDERAHGNLRIAFYLQVQCRIDEGAGYEKVPGVVDVDLKVERPRLGVERARGTADLSADRSLGIRCIGDIRRVANMDEGRVALLDIDSDPELTDLGQRDNR